VNRAFSVVIKRNHSALRSRFREQIKVTIPQLGDKKQILDLSIRNAKFYRIEQLKQLQIVDPDRHANRIMAQMQKICACR
jgi:excinuclease UvrABC nuclease subunit